MSPCYQFVGYSRDWGSGGVQESCESGWASCYGSCLALHWADWRCHLPDSDKFWFPQTLGSSCMFRV